MPNVAKVVVDLALDREFDYLVPEGAASSIRVGASVMVPFGSSRRRGYVVGLAERSERRDLKPIERVIIPCLLSDEVLRLARWMADYYCSPIELAVRAVLPGAVRRAGRGFKQRLFVTLAPQPPAGAAAAAGKAPKPAQTRVLDALRRGGDGMFMAHLVRLASVTAATVRALERKGLVSIAAQTEVRDPFADIAFVRTNPLELMPEQAAALRMTATAVDTLEPPVVLLHGVTGSGKTEVYLQAIAHVRVSGRGAIVLVPEISLTPQTVERFRGRFGDEVAVLHSHLSEGERHDEWHRIREGRAPIVVGARSAVFAPVQRLGLIVVDEEHDTSYKQDESPRYSARDVAVMRGRMDKCAVVLGSATPSIESYANARRGKYALAVLSHRVDHRQMPVMRIVDMRIEGEKEGVHVFSRELVEAIRTRLDRAEQTMLFLNRRGYATALVCPKCGEVAMCPNCSIAFTYHRQTEELRCHVCGELRRVPPKCPKCGDPAFKFAGVGTQRVEGIVKKLFPKARVQRMDSDVTGPKHSHARILGDFKTGKTDILIGTQMIAKGLDFPNVTLIGVVYADLSLHMPDFRAGERTFQLLTQVAGRAGRGDVPGEVIVQTYTPFNVAVQAARNLDFEGFYDKEVEFRRELSYPPFSHLVCVGIRGPSEARAAFVAAAFAKALAAKLPAQVIASAATPAPLAKAKGQYRFQIILRSRSARAVSEPLKAVLRQFRWPQDVSFAVDVDAVSLM